MNLRRSRNSWATFFDNANNAGNANNANNANNADNADNANNADNEGNLFRFCLLSPPPQTLTF